MGTQSRPNLPLPLMREVRQRCGFGCVLCGIPLYEYDHIFGWANTHEHKVDEITLLCDRHHSEKTKGLLPNDAVIEANKDPFNLRSGVSAPYALHYSGSECEVSLGTFKFTTSDDGYGTEIHAVRIDAVPMIAVVLGDGHYLLNVNLFDSFNRPVLRIVNNELVLRPDAWDVEFVGRSLIVREESRKILLDVQFDAPSSIRVKRGRLMRNGVELLITPEWSALLNNSTFFRDFSQTGGMAGLVLGNDSDDIACGVRVPMINRYDWDRKAAIKWAKNSASRSISDLFRTIAIQPEELSSVTIVEDKVDLREDVQSE